MGSVQALRRVGEMPLNLERYNNDGLGGGVGFLVLDILRNCHLKGWGRFWWFGWFGWFLDGISYMSEKTSVPMIYLSSKVSLSLSLGK